MSVDLNVVLLHDKMVDRQGELVTTSLTLIDLHDIARSCKTYSAHAFVAHPSPTMRKLAHIMKSYWEDGFGALYNPHRRTALLNLDISTSLDEVIHKIDLRAGKLPKIVATSAHQGEDRTSFQEMRDLLQGGEPYLLMLGTGWGMSDHLLARADYFLEPIKGAGDYNHLSVRSACATILDRLMGQ
ncbi:MAG: RNA methyltransferase [Bdellovibrionota bacterium]|jgi:hypothetical protein